MTEKLSCTFQVIFLLPNFMHVLGQEYCNSTNNSYFQQTSSHLGFKITLSYCNYRIIKIKIVHVCIWKTWP